MTRRITLRGRTVEVSNEQFSQLAHFGTEVVLNMYGTMHNSEALQQPAGGHPPRIAQETSAAMHRESETERLHSIVEQMRASRGL